MQIQLNRRPHLALLACLAISLCSAYSRACPADLTGNAEVDIDDLLVLISAWGDSGPADLTQDGVVGVDDLLTLINAWGPCPPTCDELSWIPTFGAAPGFNETVAALAVFDDGSGDGPALYAGGYFFVAGGASANRIAKWDGSSWSPVGGGTNYGIAALTVFDDGSGGGPALYAGGDFTIAGGVSANGIAKWNGSSWSALGSGTTGGFSGKVAALAVFDDGTGDGPALFAGGDFTTAGGVTVNRIAKWNGSSWSALGSGMDSDVLSLTVFDDGSGSGPALYAGGYFFTAGGVAAKHVAKWDGSSWSPLGSGMFGIYGAVFALAVFDDGSGDGPALYAGGSFETAGGVTAWNIAKWNGSSWSALGSSLAGEVYALTVFDDGSGGGPALYASGPFGIDKWNGSSWSALSGGIGTVMAMKEFDDGSGNGPALCAGGYFFTAGGVAANHIAQWNGSSWSPLGSVGSLNLGVSALIVFDDGSTGAPALYAGGAFIGAGGVNANRIAKWNGSSWSALGSGVNSPVHALTVFDDSSGGGPALYAGGNFTTAGGVSAPYIARWNGSSWSALGSGMNFYIHVETLTVFDDGSGSGPALFAGGWHPGAVGVGPKNIGRWNGTSWSNLGGGVNDYVFGLAVFDDGLGHGPALYAGGRFTTAGGVSANRIAKWNGLSWSPLGSGMNNDVSTFAVLDDGSGSGPALYAGGPFTTAGGVSANHVAKWNGSSWSALGSGMDGWVVALTAFDDGTGPALYAGGQFIIAGSISANRIAKWNGSSWSLLESGMDHHVQALAVFDDGSGGGPALHASGAFYASPAGDSFLAKWGCPAPK